LAKIQSQLLNYANMFVSTTAGGFAATYNTPTTATGEQANQFFTATTDAFGNITDVSSLSVNASLLSDATTVKAAAITPISQLFSSTKVALNIPTPDAAATLTNTFSANGITSVGQTYAGITNDILSGFQQQANAIQSSSSSAATQQNYYQTALSAETGVNTDTELVNLTSWQNSYAATAHVISVIQSMLTVLEGVIP